MQIQMSRNLKSRLILPLQTLAETKIQTKGEESKIHGSSKGSPVR